ncbi:HNH endonuclease [Corynebacterium callunae]|uniref:HNH endonuclease n=1 Tax=Corynebacterium callunae TaxID=1721 RepID=UPI003CD0D8B9
MCTRIEKNRDQRERKALHSGPKSARPCGFCGNEIAADRRRDTKFCSKECIDDYRTKFVDRTDYIRSTQSLRTAYTREWRKKNPASVRTSKFKRRQFELTGSISERDWRRTVNRYHNKCAYCGQKCAPTMDHVIPLSRGGTNNIGNILPACLPCNASKHAKFLIECRVRKSALLGIR